jgi:tetratricopeptide (TPR) repeat protein/serine/threonine protein kinase
MHAAPEPSRSAPASQGLPETRLTAPHVPEPSRSASAPESPALPAPPAPPSFAETLLAQVCHYHIEGEIARGGMGVVLRAHDDVFGRALAVKVLLERHHERSDLSRRFLEEAQLMGQMQHPGIPPVYDRGQLPDGRPFFTMKLIRGRTLAELLKERQEPAHDLPQFLAIFGQLCQAVAYAHSRGILHRDLKPSNVMVGAFGEVQVMDWGLAKLLGSARRSETSIQAEDRSTIVTVRTAEDDLLTQEGDVMGTPAYMAPEQARGQVDQLDERCDVFGLGAILCVLLTGKPPYVAATKAEVYRQAKEAALTDAYARLEACGADKALVRLAKGCLTLDLAERPRHAGLVAEAVAAYQAQVQERLQQAEVARAQALVKVQEERKRRRVTLAAVVVVLLGGSAAGWWYQQQAAVQQRRRDEAQQGLEASLSEAGKLRAVGLQQVDNPSAWGNTLAAAWAALDHARTLLNQEPELAETALAQQAHQAQAQLEADRKDWQLLAVYEQVRQEQSQWDLQRHDFKMAEAYPRLQKALADYGLDIGSLEPGQAAERLQQRPSVVQPYLRAVLEECLAWAPKEQGAQRQWLAAVLAVDADPWLKEFRKAVAERAWAEVEKMARQAEVVRYHPAVLAGLARNLPKEARTSKVQLLRWTQQQYPGDFWVNLDLGLALYWSVFHSRADRPARVEELPAVNEAVAFLRVAVGLRPGNAPTHTTLGIALAAQGNVKEAMACYYKALTLDPKLAYAHYNLGNALQAQGDLKGAINCWRKALALNPKYALAHVGLGTALYATKDVSGAIACFHKAIALDPKLALAHHNLGVALKAQGDMKGAMACYRKALDLAPRDAKAHNNLGNALKAQGDLKEAIACFHKALDLDPKFASAHNSLGMALRAQGDLKGAIACYHKALELDPKYVHAHNNLGNALKDQKDYKGAIACYTKALELDPKDAKAHNNLGNALYEQGDVKGAIACYHKALDLDPKLAQAYYNLGNALKAQGDVKGAIACYQEALTLDPKLALAHTNLGNALKAQGDVKGAIACYQKALALDPKQVNAHYNLGLALQVQGDLKGAIECFHKVLDLDPKNAMAYGVLGQALLAQGAFTEARAATQQALKLLPAGHPLRPLVARQLHECQRLLDLDVRLTAIDKGAAQPQDTAEQLALADLCQRYNKRYAAAARFYADAFAAGATQSSQRAYNASCAATLAAAGKGEDAAKLDAKEKTRLRQQALAWLKNALKILDKLVEDPERRNEVRQKLQHWQKDPDFDSVRGKEALAQLPAAERAAWQQLWAEVEALRKKTQASTK